MSRPKRNIAKIRLVGLVAVLLVTCAVFVVISGLAAPLNGQAIRQIPSVGDFSLTRADGSAFTREDLKGHWTVLTFGYTSCPDICPSALAYFRDELNQLKEQKDVQFVFVSVDPKRDSLAKLKEYAAFFHPQIRAVTGNDQQLKNFLGMFHAYAAVPESKEENYAVGHSSQFYLVNPEGQWQLYYSPPLAKGALSQDISNLQLRKRWL